MALIQFSDLPSTSTPLNSSNLNNNFEYLNNKFATVLWTNPNPTSSFAGQQLPVSNLGYYKYYEIIFITYAESSQSLSTRVLASTGKIPTSNLTKLFWFDEKMRFRNITAISSNSITFGDGLTYNTYGSSTTATNNGLCIPYQILGYK